MYWKPEFISEFSALFLTADHAAEEKYQLNDSHCGELHLAVPSACMPMQGHFFHIPAVPLQPGWMVSVCAGNFSRYMLNYALPGVYDLIVTVSSFVRKTLSRVFCFRTGGRVAVSRGKRSFRSFRPCVLRL